MQCRYFKDKECDSMVINDKQCNNCLIKEQATVLADIDERIKRMEVTLDKIVSVVVTPVSNKSTTKSARKKKD